MSYYKDFVHDFPDRCYEILNRGFKIFRDKEVTLMIMVASSGLVIPYERLTRRKEVELKKSDGLPAYERAKSLAELLQLRLSDELPFWTWIHKSVKYKQVSKPHSLEFVADENIPDSWTIREFLKVIRNALAHGNIYTKSGSNGQIEYITFGGSIKLHSETYHILSFQIKDFRRFLMEWFMYLKNTRLDSAIIPADEETYDSSPAQMENSQSNSS